MTTAVVHYTAAAVSDKGRKRPGNEDAFGFSIEHGVYVVCDGMGGAAAGEIASSLAVDEMLRILSARTVAEPMPGVAEQAIAAANAAIHSRSQRSNKLSGMGTTMDALLLVRDRAFYAHVGDSRIYLMRQGKVHQITEDHSLVEEQVRAEMARRKPDSRRRARLEGER